MRRWRDEADAGDGVADARDLCIDLVAGQRPPSPGLAPCAILIWSSVGVDEIVGGDAEAAAGDLLDGAERRRIAVGIAA
jgi:hypothetical protein